jgi:hypothetical protein
MSRTSAASAEAEPIPTPTPASELRAPAPQSFREMLRIVGARRDPSVEAARAEAYDRYREDPDVELAAFASCTHPLQRTCSPPQIEETQRLAAASFARLPAKRE